MHHCNQFMVYVMLGTELMAHGMLGKHSTNRATSRLPSKYFSLIKFHIQFEIPHLPVWPLLHGLLAVKQRQRPKCLFTVHYFVLSTLVLALFARRRFDSVTSIPFKCVAILTGAVLKTLK